MESGTNIDFMNPYSQQFHDLLTINGLLALLTLTVLEIVLGIDNIIFVSIIAGRLGTKREQRSARFAGLLMAMLIRIGLLFLIGWVLGLARPLVSFWGIDFTGKDVILLGGGIFLLVKTVGEIHSKIEGEGEKQVTLKRASMAGIILQVVLIDIVFSFDSILTAVGVVDNIIIMMVAVVISMIIMLLLSEKVSEFIEKHPGMKMLALAFLLMIGVLLVAAAFHKEIPKEYIYCSMAFAFFVEFLNMRMRKKQEKK